MNVGTEGACSRDVKRSANFHHGSLVKKLPPIRPTDTSPTPQPGLTPDNAAPTRDDSTCTNRVRQIGSRLGCGERQARTTLEGRMYNLITQTFYAGLIGLELPDGAINLGYGITLSPADAFFLESRQLSGAPEGMSYAGKQLCAHVQVQLSIPVNAALDFKERETLAAFIVMLLRYFISPNIMLYVISEFDLSNISKIPYECFRHASIGFAIRQERHFALAPYYPSIDRSKFAYVVDKWQSAYQLYVSQRSFRLLADSLDAVQFLTNTGLSLVALWGALEIIFAPGQGKIKQRLSENLSSYLEAPGDARDQLRHQVSVLYKKRSGAAHGDPKHVSADILASIIIARRIIYKMINNKNIPVCN